MNAPPPDSDFDDDIPILIDHSADALPPPSGTTAAPPPSTVPLTIITGFLGAGKSSLLRHLLTADHGYRIAVIMNEFGDTADIESRSISINGTDDVMLELANGCLCCSIKDAGVAAIEKLLRTGRGRFDYVVLETTGLADPGPIASMFWHNEEFSSPGIDDDGMAGIALDGVVCVVDAVFGMEVRTDPSALDGAEDIGESVKQIASADVVIVNKIDLVSPSSLTPLLATIHTINPAAAVYRSVRGAVDVAQVLGVGAYKRVGGLVPLQPHDHAHDDTCTHEHEHAHARTIRDISALTVRIPPLPRAQLRLLDAWVRAALWEGFVPVPSLPNNTVPNSPYATVPPPNDAATPDAVPVLILRCKGHIPMRRGAPYVLQGVRSLYELRRVGDGVDGEEEGKIVLIGKGLDERVRGSLEGVFR
ncbi:hypothetical protein PLICRDRAFT_157170 [Plicaturopsis crispa FD-325 SS-3]|nr:hypothetical protein PLICRDRAFT_157170 [Plicaturopsis crispa FD-325 SS-3]